MDTVRPIVIESIISNGSEMLLAHGQNYSVISSACMSANGNASGCNNGNSSGADGSSGNPFILPWYLQITYILIFVLMVIVAAGGNVIVIWIVMAHRRMRTVTNYFLVNLAIADALMSIFNTLFNFVYMLYSDWPFGKAYCKFSQFISPCTISASVFTFMAIAIDRYVAIVHPLKPRMAAKTVLGMITFIWLASILLAFPNLLYADTYTWHYPSGDSRTVCYVNWPDGIYSSMDFVYNIFLMLVTYFVPLGALAGTYARVGMELWGSRTIGEVSKKHEQTTKSKRKVVKMMIVVVAIFAVCWLPQHVFFLVTNQHPNISKAKNIQQIYLVIYWLAMSNSMYNPIIYCWMNQRFRQGFKSIFRCLPCVRMYPSDVWGCPNNRTTLSETTFSNTHHNRLTGRHGFQPVCVNEHAF